MAEPSDQDYSSEHTTETETDSDFEDEDFAGDTTAASIPIIAAHTALTSDDRTGEEPAGSTAATSQRTGYPTLPSGFDPLAAPFGGALCSCSLSHYHFGTKLLPQLPVFLLFCCLTDYGWSCTVTQAQENAKPAGTKKNPSISFATCCRAALLGSPGTRSLRPTSAIVSPHISTRAQVQRTAALHWPSTWRQLA